VLTASTIRHGHEAHADRRGFIRSDDDLSRALGEDSPAQRLCPKACEARQIMGIHDDVMQPYSHAVSVLAALAYWLRPSRCGPPGRSPV
jgi:hypothetical protein